MRAARVLMIGGMPPPFQGQSIAFAAAVQAVGGAHASKVIDFSRRRKGIKSFLDLICFMIAVPLALITFRPTKIYFLCSRSFVGGLRDIYLLLFFRMSSADVYNHLHGSDFGEYYSSRSIWLQKLLKVLYRRVNYHAVLIEGMQEQLEAVAPSANIVVVNNFFEDFTQPLEKLENKGRCSDGLSICFLSSICRSKGVFDVIDAFKIFEQGHPGAKLRIAGAPIDDEFGDAKSHHHKLSHASVSNPNIEYLGELDKSEKYELLNKSDIFCLPSSFRSEAVPLAIIEAMAAGCVIVVYDHKYLSMVVKDGVNGFVAPTSTPTSLSACWFQIASDANLRCSISKFNMEHARLNFSEAKYKAAVLKFLSY